MPANPLYVKKEIVKFSDTECQLNMPVKLVNFYVPDITLFDKPLVEYISTPTLRHISAINDKFIDSTINSTTQDGKHNTSSMYRIDASTFGGVVINPDMITSLVGYRFSGIVCASVSDKKIIEILHAELLCRAQLHMKDKQARLDKAIQFCA